MFISTIRTIRVIAEEFGYELAKKVKEKIYETTEEAFPHFVGKCTSCGSEMDLIERINVDYKTLSLYKCPLDLTRDWSW